MISAGKSPAREKARDKARVKDAETFGAWAEKWLRGYQMADSTRDMRKSVYTRELKKQFGNQKLAEITHEDLRALTDAIVDRGGASHGSACSRSGVANLPLGNRTRAEGREPGGNGAPDKHRQIRATRPCADTGRDRSDVSVHGSSGDFAAIPSGDQAVVADDGSKIGAVQCQMVRDQFQRGALDYPEKTVERLRLIPNT